MKHIHPAIGDRPQPGGRQVLAALAVTVLFIVCFKHFYMGLKTADYGPLPYVWTDVAIVHILCALPLAAVLAALVRRRATAGGSFVLAAFCLAISLAPMMNALAGTVLKALLLHPLIGTFVRSACALGVTFSAALLGQAIARVELFANCCLSVYDNSRRSSGAAIVISMLLMLLLPWTYVGQRSRHDLARLGELLEQSRFGEASNLVHGIMALDAQSTFNGYPLNRLAMGLDRSVREIEAQAGSLLGEHATAAERLDRARQLAMLGRTEAALVVLEAVQDPAVLPEAANLVATIYENRSNWSAALTAYSAARTLWQAQPHSPQSTTSLSRAITGVAYAQRKLGKYAEAEVAYQDLLALSPTAGTHFLLAQFYDDAQQADKARAHARRAIELSPNEYRQKGEKLIDKLSAYQFGCLGVFVAESSGN